MGVLVFLDLKFSRGKVKARSESSTLGNLPKMLYSIIYRKCQDSEYTTFEM